MQCLKSDGIHIREQCQVHRCYYSCECVHGFILLSFSFVTDTCVYVIVMADFLSVTSYCLQLLYATLFLLFFNWMCLLGLVQDRTQLCSRAIGTPVFVSIIFVSARIPRIVPEGITDSK